MVCMCVYVWIYGCMHLFKYFPKIAGNPLYVKPIHNHLHKGVHKQQAGELSNWPQTAQI